MNTEEKKKKKFLPRLIFWLIVAAILFIGLWFGLRAALVKSVSTGIDNLKTQGYQVNHDGLTVTGFPFSIDANSSGITLQAPTSQNLDPAKNWSVRLDQVSLNSTTITPLSWDMTHRGTVRIDMRGPRGERYMFDVTAAKLDAFGAASITGKLKSAHIDLAPTHIQSVVGTPLALQAAGPVTADLKIIGTDGHLSMAGRDLIISEQALGVMSGILGRKLEIAEADIVIKNWPGLEAEGAEIWRQNGGRIVCENWRVQWGQINMVGDFSFEFKDGTPMGVIHLKVKDIDALLGNLTKAGLLPQNMSSQARLLVGLIEIDQDGRKELEFTLNNGVLKYGFVTLHKF